MKKEVPTLLFVSEFENRDPGMAMTFIVRGSGIFAEGGVLAPTVSGFLRANSSRTGYMITKFLGETIEATQFQGYYRGRAQGKKMIDELSTSLEAH